MLQVAGASTVLTRPAASPALTSGPDAGAALPGCVFGLIWCTFAFCVVYHHQMARCPPSPSYPSLHTCRSSNKWGASKDLLDTLLPQGGELTRFTAAVAMDRELYEFAVVLAALDSLVFEFPGSLRAAGPGGPPAGSSSGRDGGTGGRATAAAAAARVVSVGEGGRRDEAGGGSRAGAGQDGGAAGDAVSRLAQRHMLASGPGSSSNIRMADHGSVAVRQMAQVAVTAGTSGHSAPLDRAAAAAAAARAMVQVDVPDGSVGSSRQAAVAAPPDRPGPSVVLAGTATAGHLNANRSGGPAAHPNNTVAPLPRPRHRSRTRPGSEYDHLPRHEHLRCGFAALQPLLV